MNLSAQKFSEISEKGIVTPGNPPSIIGELHFEPPITLNACVIIGPSLIGRYSYVGNFTHIDNHTEIGRYCSIASSCTIGAANHPTDWLSTHPFQYHAGTAPYAELRPRKEQHTKIGHDVWIGANATILAGISIGHGAIIGAGSVVTQDVQPYAVVVGATARILRYRFSEEIVAELLALAWWDLHPEAIQALPFDGIGTCLAKLRQIRGEVDDR